MVFCSPVSVCLCIYLYVSKHSVQAFRCLNFILAFEAFQSELPMFRAPFRQSHGVRIAILNDLAILVQTVIQEPRLFYHILRLYLIVVQSLALLWHFSSINVMFAEIEYLIIYIDHEPLEGALRLKTRVLDAIKSSLSSLRSEGALDRGLACILR